MFSLLRGGTPGPRLGISALNMFPYACSIFETDTHGETCLVVHNLFQLSDNKVTEHYITLHTTAEEQLISSQLYLKNVFSQKI